MSLSIQGELEKAVSEGNVDAVRGLLAVNPDYLREYGDWNRHKVVISAIAGGREHSLALVKLLERHGADLHRNYIDDISNAPINALSAAIDCDNADVVEYLRSRGLRLPGSGSDSGSANEVVEYFRDTYGPVDPRALMEIVPTAWPPIAIHSIPPSKEHDCVTLFTSGMSDEPMTVPAGEEDYQYAELFIQLPAAWPHTDLADPNHSWPTDWLRSCAQHPHLNDTWLGGPVSIIANDEPPQPLAPNTRFTCVLLLALSSFVRADGRKVQIYRMAPLYTEERDLEAREGIAALMHAFDENGIPFVVDMKRANVAVLPNEPSPRTNSPAS